MGGSSHSYIFKKKNNDYNVYCDLILNNVDLFLSWQKHVEWKPTLYGLKNILAPPVMLINTESLMSTEIMAQMHTMNHCQSCEFLWNTKFVWVEEERGDNWC